MFEVLGFYKFLKIRSLKKNKVSLQDFLINKKIRGTIIIASEGINGTISGKLKDIKSTINRLKKMFSFKEFDNSELENGLLEANLILTKRFMVSM